MGGYAFEIAEAAAGRVLPKISAGFSYDMISVCRKDSQDVTDEDRQAIAEVRVCVCICPVGPTVGQGKLTTPCSCQ